MAGSRDERSRHSGESQTEQRHAKETHRRLVHRIVAEGSAADRRWLGPVCGNVTRKAVSSGDDDAAAAEEVFRGRLQEERGHARA